VKCGGMSQRLRRSRNDQIDHIVEIGIVVDARLPRLSEGCVSECREREKPPAKQRNETELVPHACEATPRSRSVQVKLR